MTYGKTSFFLLFPLFLMVVHCSSLSAARITRGPYIENMSKEMIVFRFRTDVSTVAWITYGAYPDCERFSTISRITAEHSVTLNGLLADTTHCYRIYLPVENSTYAYKSEESYFKTFKDEKGLDFSFVVFGPSGKQDEDDKIANLIKGAEGAGFVIHMGNITPTGTDEEAESAYFSRYREILKRAPFFVALGNYEYGPDYYKNDSWRFIRENYFPYHSWPRNGSGPHYYYMDEANARFVFLDANLLFGALSAPSIEKDSYQYKWLETVLKTAKEKTWKFVVVHQPLYSSGESGGLDALRETLEPLFEKYGVDMVFQGHDRNYERTRPVKNTIPDENGVIYITLGGGGGKKKDEETQNEWSEFFSEKTSYAYITVWDKKLEMKVYDCDGEILDEVLVQK